MKSSYSVLVVKYFRNLILFGLSTLGSGTVKYMIFSSWSDKGYAVGVARSESGSAFGPWIIQKTPLFPENGGHGMFFTDLDGNLILALHYPNDRFKEHPSFWKVCVENGMLTIR